MRYTDALRDFFFQSNKLVTFICTTETLNHDLALHIGLSFIKLQNPKSNARHHSSSRPGTRQWSQIAPPFPTPIISLSVNRGPTLPSPHLLPACLVPPLMSKQLKNIVTDRLKEIGLLNTHCQWLVCMGIPDSTVISFLHVFMHHTKMYYRLFVS